MVGDFLVRLSPSLDTINHKTKHNLSSHDTVAYFQATKVKDMQPKEI